jgi:DegV family protein with EDD domain
MRKIKIVTDSTVDLSDEVIRKYEIEIVPLSVTINGKTYLDRFELNTIDFIKMMRASEELPKSSQPSNGAFLELYNRLGDEGFDVLSIHLTGKMSGTLQSAESAAKMSKANVTVVDSAFISKSLSFQVIEAAEMAKQGKSIEEIVHRLDTVRSHSHLYVMVDTLENLVKGGRIGKGRAFLGSLLNIKPIASLEGAEYHPVTKVRSYSQVVKFLTKQFAEDMKGKTIRGVGIVHAEALELALKVKESITELTGYQDIDISYTNPVIITHTGEGAVALMYYYDE